MRFERGEPVFRPDSPPQGLYVVVTGAVRLSDLDPSGQETTVAVVAPGQVFGASSLFLRDGYRHLAVSMDKTQVCFLPTNQVDRMLCSSLFAGRLMRALAKRMRQVEDFAVIRSYASVTQRLAHLFRVLGEDFGFPVEGKIALSLPLTHEDLARMVSVTRPHVSRSLERLRRRGMVAFHGRSIFLHTTKELQLIESSRGRTLCATWRCDPVTVETAPEVI